MNITAALTNRIESWYRSGLAAVEPSAAVRRHLALEHRDLIIGRTRVPVAGRLLVVGVGKAAVGMARGAEAVCGALVDDGLVITKDGHTTGEALRRIRVAEAAHPVPDERGVRATREMLSLFDRLETGDVVLALISGGGSALLEAPRPPLTLADLAVTTDLLLRTGASIQELNAVRIPLSLVKGGGLRRAAAPAAMITLILSDVLGNDPAIIASGPTVAGSVTAADALAVIERFGLQDRVPPAVISALTTDTGGDRRADDSLFAHDVVVIVGDNAAAVRAVADAVAADGLRPEVVWSEQRGEAAELGRAWVAACDDAPDRVDVLLGGGEATVTVRGGGIGGRNTEFALAAALEFDRRRMDDWVIASLATDGQDALTGVAGAIADRDTVRRALAAGVDPAAALRDNDSLRVFEAAGGLVKPGPTGTNVNDVYVAVRTTTLTP